VRKLILASALTAFVVAPVAAAGLDPSKLVLRQTDVPSGFRPEAAEGGVRSNELESKGNPELRTLFRRWGRLTGYEAVYERGNEAAVINSRADVFRRPAGARGILVWFDRELIKGSPVSLRRAAVRIGEAGWVYSGPGVTIVVWRDGRVFAGVSGEGLGRERTLALARVQQRRIAAALR